MPQTLGTDPEDGISGMGTTLQGATTGPLGMVDKIQIAGAEVDEYDITTMNSASAYKRFIAGLKDAKEITVDLIYGPRNTKLILSKLGAAVENWTVKFPDGCTYVTSGYIKKLGQAIPHDNKITQSLTIRLSGPPTFNLASGISLP